MARTAEPSDIGNLVTTCALVAPAAEGKPLPQISQPVTSFVSQLLTNAQAAAAAAANKVLSSPIKENSANSYFTWKCATSFSSCRSPSTSPSTYDQYLSMMKVLRREVQLVGSATCSSPYPTCSSPASTRRSGLRRSTISYAHRTEPATESRDGEADLERARLEPDCSHSVHVPGSVPQGHDVRQRDGAHGLLLRRAGADAVLRRGGLFFNVQREAYTADATTEGECLIMEYCSSMITYLPLFGRCICCVRCSLHTEEESSLDRNSEML